MMQRLFWTCTKPMVQSVSWGAATADSLLDSLGRGTSWDVGRWTCISGDVSFHKWRSKTLQNTMEHVLYMYCIWELHVGLGNKFSKFQTPHQGQISQQGVPAARPRPRCWFDYNSQNPSCSPYVGILRYLQRKKLATPWSQGGMTSLGWLEWRVFVFFF